MYGYTGIVDCYLQKLLLYRKVPPAFIERILWITTPSPGNHFNQSEPFFFTKITPATDDYYCMQAQSIPYWYCHKFRHYKWITATDRICSTNKLSIDSYVTLACPLVALWVWYAIARILYPRKVIAHTRNVTSLVPRPSTLDSASCQFTTANQLIARSW